jgi:hypothetical protein
MRSLAAASAAAALTVLLGCVKEISSEERLDRETDQGPLKQPISVADLAKISCAGSADELARARNVDRDETARLMAYTELFRAIKEKVAKLEEAMSRDPDLRYQDAARNVVDAHETCIQQQADVRLELETFVRELVQVPIVEEVKGGSTVSVARLDYNTLRLAIETLSPDDKDALLVRIASAEKKIEQQQQPQSDVKRRKR